MNRQRIIFLSLFAVFFIGISGIIFARSYNESHERFRVGLPIPKNILPAELLTEEELYAGVAPTMPAIQDNEMTLFGNSNSPVTIMLFGDFQSDLSRNQSTSLEQAIEELEAQESIRVIWRDLPDLTNHSKALLSAIAARCAADQNAFKSMHDLLFSEASTYDSVEFIRFARKSKMNEQKFTICMNDPAHEFRIQQSIEEAQQNGINQIPTLFINGVYQEGYVDKQALVNLLRYQLRTNATQK